MNEYINYLEKELYCMKGFLNELANDKEMVIHLYTAIDIYTDELNCIKENMAYYESVLSYIKGEKIEDKETLAMIKTELSLDNSIATRIRKFLILR